MKIVAINGSPKGTVSNSMELISLTRERVPGAEWHVVSSIAEWRKPGGAIDALLSADVILVAFPLYVDGMPASLMALLERFAGARKGGEPKRCSLYAAANCGFYEGKQNGVALEILGHYARANGLEWRGGIGIGTGEMISHMKNMSERSPIRKPVIRAIDALSSAISADRPLDGSPLFTQHGFPEFAFKLAGESGWRSMIKKNGKLARDLGAQPLSARIGR